MDKQKRRNNVKSIYWGERESRCGSRRGEASTKFMGKRRKMERREGR